MLSISKLLIFSLCIAALTTCTSRQVQNQNEDLDLVYQGAGIDSYILSQLPSWANFSTLYRCQRKEDVVYLNFDNLKKSYNLSYAQLIQFQFTYNNKLKEMKKSTGRDIISNEQKSFAFFNTYEKILGGSYDFILPRYNKVNLFWLDPWLDNASGRQKLAAIFKNEKMLLGQPVIISDCFSREYIGQVLATLELDTLGIKIVPASMLTPYSNDFKLNNSYNFYIKEIFNNHQITFLAPFFPYEIKGADSKRKI